MNVAGIVQRIIETEHEAYERLGEDPNATVQGQAGITWERGRVLGVHRIDHFQSRARLVLGPLERHLVVLTETERAETAAWLIDVASLIARGAPKDPDAPVLRALEGIDVVDESTAREILTVLREQGWGPSGG